VKFGGIYFYMRLNNDEINPAHILLKLSWKSSIEMLNDKERSTILTNIFRYHTGDELAPMTKAATMFFASASDVFEYNTGKYQKKVIDNRINGQKGGRPKKENQDGLKNNPNNPHGFSNNPENPKDKDRDKGIDRDKSIDRVIEKDRDIVISKENPILISKENPLLKPDLNFKLEKFKKISELACQNFKDIEDKNFCAVVKELADEIGWLDFSKLILETTLDDALALAKTLGLINMDSSISDVRQHHIYYLNKLVK